MDGDRWYRFRRQGNELAYEGNGSAESVTSLFRLEVDVSEIESKIVEIGPEIKPAIKAMSGIRLMRPSSLVETVFTFMCTANNNLSRIIPMTWKLGSYGELLSEGFNAFPSVERIASIPEEDLRNSAFGYRAATIPNAAKEIENRGGEIWLDALKQCDYQDLIKELVTLPGIGPKLADCIALYGYDRGEAVPLDTHIWQVFTRLYHPAWKDKAVTDFRYRESTNLFRARFGYLSGWAHLFLFFANLTKRNRE